MFYEEFEDVCARANNCKGMSAREPGSEGTGSGLRAPVKPSQASGTPVTPSSGPPMPAERSATAASSKSDSDDALPACLAWVLTIAGICNTDH